MSIPYDPDIPQASDAPSESQPDILQNFQSINAILNVDLYNFGTGTPGKHKQVTFPSAVAQGTPVASEGILYTALDGLSKAQLYFKNNTNNFQLTNSVTSGINSRGQTEYTIITPFGLTLKFGTSEANSAGITTVFASNFTTAALGVIISPRHAGGLTSAVTGPTGNSQFVAYIQAGPGTQAIYYVAWGN